MYVNEYDYKMKYQGEVKQGNSDIKAVNQHSLIKTAVVNGHITIALSICVNLAKVMEGLFKRSDLVTQVKRLDPCTVGFRGGRTGSGPPLGRGEGRPAGQQAR